MIKQPKQTLHIAYRSQTGQFRKASVWQITCGMISKHGKSLLLIGKKQKCKTGLSVLIKKLTVNLLLTFLQIPFRASHDNMNLRLITHQLDCFVFIYSIFQSLPVCQPSSMLISDSQNKCLLSMQVAIFCQKYCQKCVVYDFTWPWMKFPHKKSAVSVDSSSHLSALSWS